MLTAFEHYPEWAADIKAVAVDERDEDGRATLVTFRAAAFGRSTSYTLKYDYAKAPDELSWVQVNGDITRRLDGSYHLTPVRRGDGDRLSPGRRPQGAPARLRQAPGRGTNHGHRPA